MVNLVILVALTAVIVPLSTARLTRIVFNDRIGEPIRKWVAKKFGLDSMLHYMVSLCYWCLGVHAAWLHVAVALAAFSLFGPLPWHITGLLFIPASLAVSDIAGRILDHEGI
jgi:hypothetical protein